MSIDKLANLSKTEQDATLSLISGYQEIMTQIHNPQFLTQTAEVQSMELVRLGVRYFEKENALFPSGKYLVNCEKIPTLCNLSSSEELIEKLKQMGILVRPKRNYCYFALMIN